MFWKLRSVFWDYCRRGGLHWKAIILVQPSSDATWQTTSSTNDPTFLTAALFTNASRNRVDFQRHDVNRTSSSSYSYKNTLLIFSYILKAKYIFSIGRWIANLLEKMRMNSVQSCCLSLRNKILSNDIILHKLEWRHGTRLVTGLRRRSLASVSPCGGGGGGDDYT